MKGIVLAEAPGQTIKTLTGDIRFNLPYCAKHN